MSEKQLDSPTDLIEELGTPSTMRSISHKQTIALIAICAGFFMVMLDTTIVTVALPNIREHLAGTVTGLQWLVDGYLILFASFLLSAGTLGDRIGNKHVFLAGIALFTLSSALCGIAPNLEVLELARVLQRVRAALLVPPSLSLLSHTFATQKERARAIGIWGGIAGIGAGAGPVIGGILVNSLDWRSVFLVNIPIGILGFVLTVLFVTPVPRLQRGLDLFAQILAILALGSLTFVCIEGKEWGWTSPPILLAFVLFIVTLVLFLTIEYFTKEPMLPLQLFKSPTFSAANTIGVLLNFGFYGQLFCLTIFFQTFLGYSALICGLALLPQTGMAVIASTLSGRVTGQVGPRIPMVLGLLIGSIGLFALLFVQKTTSYALISIMLIATGFGTAFTMPAMTAAVIESAPKERTGTASAILNTSRQIGSALGVALLGSFISEQTQFIKGFHAIGIIAGLAFFLGALLALFAIRPHAKQHHSRGLKTSAANTIVGESSDTLLSK